MTQNDKNKNDALVTFTKNDSVTRAKYEVFSYQYMKSRKDPSLSQNIAASLELSKNICSMLLFTSKTRHKTWFYLIIKFWSSIHK